MQRLLAKSLSKTGGRVGAAVGIAGGTFAGTAVQFIPYGSSSDHPILEVVGCALVGGLAGYGSGRLLGWLAGAGADALGAGKGIQKLGQEIEKISSQYSKKP